MTGADALDTVELPDLLDFCCAAACFCSRLVSCACCSANVPVVRPSGNACQQPAYFIHCSKFSSLDYCEYNGGARIKSPQNHRANALLGFNYKLTLSRKVKLLFC